MSGSHQASWIPCFYHVDSLSLEEWLLSFKRADTGCGKHKIQYIYEINFRKTHNPYTVNDFSLTLSKIPSFLCAHIFVVFT